MTVQNSTNAALARNILFQLVMQDLDILPKFLSFATGKMVRLVPPVEGEKTITLDIDKKGVRFDIYALDEDGTIYDIEMENRGESLDKRLRYYQSTMNNNMISRGDLYTKVKSTKIIVVCSFDHVGDGLYRYHIDRVYRHKPGLRFTEDEEIILLNSKGKYGDLPEELKEFLMLINGIDENTFSKLKTEFGKKVYSKMQQILNNKKYKEAGMFGMWFQAELMDSKEKGLIAGRAEGLASGKAEGAQNTLEALKLHKLGYSKDEIMAATGVSAENIDKMIEILG